jgi:hypothetical protein
MFQGNSKTTIEKDSFIYIAILNELWKKAILKNLLKAKDLKMSD